MRFVKKLSLETKNQLEELMKESKSHKVRRRAHAILLSAKGYKIEQLANIFDVDRDTISQWLSRWENVGIIGLKDNARSGRPKKNKDSEKKNKHSFLVRVAAKFL